MVDIQHENGIVARPSNSSNRQLKRVWKSNLYKGELEVPRLVQPKVIIQTQLELDPEHQDLVKEHVAAFWEQQEDNEKQEQIAFWKEQDTSPEYQLLDFEEPQESPYSVVN